MNVRTPIPRFAPAVPLAAALLLAACGGSGGGNGPSADPETLIVSSYAVTAITVDGSEREVLGPITFSFTADSISVATPCNGMSGPVTYSVSNVTVGDLARTEMACEPALMDQDQFLADTLAAKPAWTVADGKLTLTLGSTAITADSAADDRQASPTDGVLGVLVNNNSDVIVQLKTRDIDPADWNWKRKPDQFNNVNLGVNTFKEATLEIDLWQQSWPFRLQFWKYSPTTAEPTELIAQIDLEVVMGLKACGLTLRGEPEAPPCALVGEFAREFAGDARQFYTKDGYVLRVVNRWNHRSDVVLTKA